MEVNIKVDIRESVATVTLDRPEKLNTLTDEMKERLPRLFAELNGDDEVRSVILTGAGRGFCAGGDVGTMKDFTPKSAQVRLANAQAVVMALAEVDKPVVAAVRGPVAGIGWSLAMACDLIVASETTTFHQSFKRIGLVPDGGAIFFLMQTLGPVRAKELVFSARPLPAEEALSYGLVNQVVADGQLEQEARKLALEMACGPTLAFSLAKRLFRSAAPSGLRTFLDAEASAQGVALFSNDHEEGARAFREKREPRFLGS